MSKLKLIIVCGFSFISYSSIAQSAPDSLKIQGCLIADSSHEGIAGAYIKISSKQRPYILAYVNTGKENCFSIKVPFITADTFFITASHVIYQTITISRYITLSGNSEIFDILMPLQKNVLGEVVIKTPPVWVRGDTTFFKADFFKEGEEKKLKELIVKMPGFEIDKGGNLLYRKRRIEKITIEGEEIFADKINLLLNSVPVHVLNTLQVLENQNENKLLKGLTAENKVFLNLSIKKEKLKTAFGDGEAGIGTAGRYAFAPTLFALYGKTKLGFIGNENSTGSGFDWGEENELKNDAGKEAEEWMMNSKYLQTVNNFGSKRYIFNQKWDNRLQINTPVSKKLKSQLEIGFLKDRQTQNTYYNSTLYNDSFYFKRIDTNAIRHQPLIFSAREELTWNIDSAKELKTSVQFYYNGTDSRHKGLYKEEIKTFSIENNIHNNWKSFSFNTEFTHRTSVTAATRWFLSASASKFGQKAKGVSDDWATIFQLPENYKILDQIITNNVNSITAGAERLKKTKAGVLTTDLVADWSKFNISNKTVFSDINHTLPTLKSDYFSNDGKYNIVKLTGHSQQSVRVFHQPMLFKLGYGIAHASLLEVKNKKNFVTPLYSLEISQQTRISKPVLFNYSVRYSQKQAEPWNLYSANFPKSVSSFQRNSNISQPVKMLTGNLSVGINWGNFVSSYTGLLYQRNFSGFVSTSIFDQLLQITLDTLIRRSVDNFSISNNISFPSLLLKAKIELGGEYSLNKGYIIYRENLLVVNYYWYNLMAIIKRNWDRKYFITLEAHYSTKINKLPRGIADNVSKKISDLRILLKQRSVIKKSFGLSFNAEWYKYSMFTNNTSSILFADLECTYSLPGKPWSFSVMFSNITNQRFFYSQNNYPLIQSFYSFPLVERNFFISVRYEL